MQPYSVVLCRSAPHRSTTAALQILRGGSTGYLELPNDMVERGARPAGQQSIAAQAILGAGTTESTPGFILRTGVDIQQDAVTVPILSQMGFLVHLSSLKSHYHRGAGAWHFYRAPIHLEGYASASLKGQAVSTRAFLQTH